MQTFSNGALVGSDILTQLRKNGAECAIVNINSDGKAVGVTGHRCWLRGSHGSDRQQDLVIVFDPEATAHEILGRRCYSGLPVIVCVDQKPADSISVPDGAQLIRVAGRVNRAGRLNDGGFPDNIERSQIVLLLPNGADIAFYRNNPNLQPDGTLVIPSGSFVLTVKSRSESPSKPIPELDRNFHPIQLVAQPAAEVRNLG